MMHKVMKIEDQLLYHFLIHLWIHHLQKKQQYLGDLYYHHNHKDTHRFHVGVPDNRDDNGILRWNGHNVHRFRPFFQDEHTRVNLTLIQAQLCK